MKLTGVDDLLSNGEKEVRRSMNSLESSVALRPCTWPRHADELHPSLTEWAVVFFALFH